MARLYSKKYLFWVKLVVISLSIFFLIRNSEQAFNSPILILVLLGIGYYLGKITCGVHQKNTSLGLTLFIFIIMNLVHSIMDGFTFNGKLLNFWIGAVLGHELIRQPTLYVILWAILLPFSGNIYQKSLICFFCVTLVWLLGITIGKVGGTSFINTYHIQAWLGYGIFLFIGDITHHLIDQYQLLSKKSNGFVSDTGK